MAAEPTYTNAWTGARIPELLTCPCCSELLTNPCSLPCGHRFCHECLDGVQCLTCGTPYYRQDVSRSTLVASALVKYRALLQAGGREVGPDEATQVCGANEEEEEDNGEPSRREPQGELAPRVGLGADAGSELSLLSHKAILLQRRLRAHHSLILASAYGPLAGLVNLPLATPERTVLPPAEAVRISTTSCLLRSCNPS